MSTKKHLHESSCLQEDKKYVTPILIPNECGFDVKMCVLNFNAETNKLGRCHYVSKKEVLNFSDELFVDAYQHLGSSVLLELLDPYFRCKFTNPKIYEALYFTETSGYTTTSTSADAKRAFIRNMIVLDQGAISYLYNLMLTCGNERTAIKQLHSFLTINSNYRNVKRNARLRLGISKNKEKVLKAFPQQFIVNLDNKLFDDDVDFLIEVVTTARNDTNILKKILYIKQTNPRLKYEDIVRTAINSNLNSNKNMSFSSAIYNLSSLADMYNFMVKESHFDCPFKMSTSIAHTTLEGYEPPEVDCNISVENAMVYRLTTSWYIAYANAITNAYPTDYLEQSIMKKSGFYLIVKHGKYYMCETRDSVVIGVRRNGKEALLDINYV